MKKDHALSGWCIHSSSTKCTQSGYGVDWLEGSEKEIWCHGSLPTVFPFQFLAKDRWDREGDREGMTFTS